MANDVDICNLALSFLGDDATLSSIDPPEGSVQAEHCARFYPIARDALLEMHPWAFAMRRVALALMRHDSTDPWAYRYAVPSDAASLIAVLPGGASDDAAPQAFVREVDANGNAVLRTNQAHALLRYCTRNVATSQFSTLFSTALAWHLASFLAGPLIKGDAGAAEAKRCTGMMQGYLSKAMLADTSNISVALAHRVPWITAR